MASNGLGRHLRSALHWTDVSERESVGMIQPYDGGSGRGSCGVTFYDPQFIVLCTATNCP